MGRNSLTITVSHNGTKRKVTTTSEIREEITKVICKPVISMVADSYEKGLIKAFYVAATFFQRVIARTPLDENYTYRDGKGKIRSHHKDEDVAKYDWYITDGTKTIMSKEIIEAGADCLEIDKESDIKYIADLFIKSFGLKDTTLIVGNANEHAGVLEYGGGYGWLADSTPKQGNGEGAIGLLHGVKNSHSIQAPVGMFRISLAELEEGIKLNDSMIKYQEPKQITDSDLRRFVKILSKSGNIRTKDIERFIK